MREVFERNPKAIAVVESALIFEVERDARLRGESEGVIAYWRRRFDRMITVTAPEDVKIARYVARLSPNGWDERIAADARSRLARQLSDAVKVSGADFVIENDGGLDHLKAKSRPSAPSATVGLTPPSFELVQLSTASSLGPIPAFFLSMSALRAQLRCITE